MKGRRHGQQTPPPLSAPALTCARGVLLLHLLLSPLVFSRATLEVFEFSKIALLQATALLLVGLLLWDLPGWVEVRHQATRWLREPLLLGTLLFLVSALVSTVCSCHPRTSLRGAEENYAGLGTMLAGLVLFGATRLCVTEAAHVRQLLAAAVVASAAVGVYALAQALGLDPLAWDQLATYGHYRRPLATLGQPILLGAYLTMTLPFVVYFLAAAWPRRRWFLLAGLACLLTLQVTAIVATLARAAWLALLAVSAVMAAGWCWRGGLSRRILLRAALAGALMLVGVALLLALSPAGAALGQRWQHLLNAEGRLQIWLTAWAIFRDQPLCGSGLDTFQLVFGSYRRPELWHAEWGITPTHAHNDVLQILANQGVLGGAALGLFLAGLGHTCLRAWRQLPEQRPLLVALCASLLALFLTSLVGFTVAATGSLFLTVCAALSALTSQPAGRCDRVPVPPGWSPWYARVPLCCLLVFAFVQGIGLPFWASSQCRQGDLLLAQTDERALTCYERALALAPGDDALWARLGLAQRDLAQTTPVAERRQRWLGAACQSLERARALNARDPYHHARLAQVLGDQARDSKTTTTAALLVMDQALRLDPANAQFIVCAVQLALQDGNLARARADLAMGQALYPRYPLFPVLQGFVALREGRIGESIPLLAQVAHGHSDWLRHEDLYCQAQFALAVAYVHTRQPTAALPCLEAVLPKRPDWPAARQVLQDALDQAGVSPADRGKYRSFLPAHGPAPLGN